MNDLSLLKIFADRKNYNKYIDYVDLGVCSYEVRTILEAYGKYFDSVSADTCLSGDFNTWFIHGHKNLASDSIAAFKLIFNNIANANEEVVSAIIAKFQETATTKKLEEVLLNGFSSDTIKEIVEQHEKIVGTIDNKEVEGFIEHDLSKAINNTNREKGFKWRLEVLQQHTKGLLRGDLVIVGAGTDTGKTMFAISESSYMARQLKKGCVLYMNNEQNNDIMTVRITQAVTGQTESWIRNNIEEAERLYTERLRGDKDRIKFIDIRGKSTKGLAKIFKVYKPKLVVIDQADKIMERNSKREGHLGITDTYNDLRNLAQEYCPIIAVSQTDSSVCFNDFKTGEVKYQLYPHHTQLAGSKIGKPGEADIIIMIGRKADYPNSRGIHISKNKYGEAGIKKEVTFLGNRVLYKDN